MQVECVKCHRKRSTKFMQEAVFRNFVGDEGAGIYKCASNESCKKARKDARKAAETEAAKDKLRLGPPSDFGDVVCHGCGMSSDRGVIHRPDCPGVCIRQICYYHEGMNLEPDSDWRYKNWDFEG